MITFAVLVIFAASLVFYLMGRSKAIAASGGTFASLHSRPSYHGTYSALWALLVGLLLVVVVSIVWGRLNDSALMASILQSQPFETLRFFNQIDWQIWKFLFGTTWSPLSGVQDGMLDADKVGAAPLFVGTFMITIIAMLVAVPIGLFAAIYLSDFASPKVRAWAKPMLEVLAGIPTVVYGFFAAITVAPYIRKAGESMGLSVASESALAAGVVMGIMIIPFISSLYRGFYGGRACIHARVYAFLHHLGPQRGRSQSGTKVPRAI